MLNLVEEIVLLAYHDTGTNTSRGALDSGIGGAVLLDLVLHGRISVTSEEVVVVDERPTGHRVLDEVLGGISASPPREPIYWVSKIYNGISKRVRNHMMERKILRRHQAMAGGLIPYARYLPANPVVEQEMRQRLENAAHLGHAGNARTAALAGAIRALCIEKTALPDMPWGKRSAALEAVTNSCQEEAVAAAIHATREALNAFLTPSPGLMDGGVTFATMGSGND